MPARASALLIIATLATAACAPDAPGSAPTSTSPTVITSPVTTSPVTTSPVTTSPVTTSPVTTSPVTTTPVTTSPVTTSPPNDSFGAIRPVMEAFVDANELNGAGLVVVDRDDGIVHEEYLGEFGPDRVSLIASSSKMLTAGVLLRLDDQGVLDIDAPVADVVEWGSAHPEITPAQLVSNTSGLVGLIPNPLYPPYICQFSTTTEMSTCAESVFTSALDDGDVAPPATEFRYGGAQWQVAGAVAEAASGSTWAELVQETYVEPCATDSLGYNNHWARAFGFAYPRTLDIAGLEPTANPQMEGGAYIDPIDYARLLLMHLRGGECEGGRVLSEEAVATAHSDRLADISIGTRPETGYGLGWWINRDTGIISDGGAYGSVPWLDLEDGHGAYLVLEASSALGQQLFEQLAPVVADAVDAYRAGG